MEMPPIRYTSTEDGISIAYLDVGEGTPILHIPYPMNHLQLQWEHAVFRDSLEGFASRFRLVAFDGRGQGLSDRQTDENSVEKLVIDTEAVVRATGLERFALFSGFSSPVAMAFAAKHPEMVSHLLLWCPVQRSSADRENPIALDEAHRLLSKIDWQLYLETLTLWLGFNPDDDDEGAAVLEYLREGVDETAYRQLFDGLGDFNPEQLVPLIRAPTLIIQPRQGRLVNLAGARQLAAVLPESQLAIVEGRVSIPMGAEAVRILDTIEQFIGAGKQAQTSGRSPVTTPGGLRTILFTDVEGSTDLTDRLGDEGGRALMRTHEEITRRALTEFGGAEIKTMGDGFMTSFHSATSALDCAIALQRSFRTHNDTADVPVNIRIGVNAGEPIAEDDDLYGTAVIVAARVAAQAQAEEILVTEVVRLLVAGKPYLFHDRGPMPLKGFDDPVRIYAVHWEDADD